MKESELFKRSNSAEIKQYYDPKVTKPLYNISDFEK